MRNGILILFCLIFLVCCNNYKQTENLEIIDIDKAFSKMNNQRISDFANSIDYIELETNNNCLIDTIFKIFVNNQFIITFSPKQINVFDRHTGSFVNKLGHEGKDPSGYMSVPLTGIPYNETDNLALAYDWKINTYIIYDCCNAIVKKISFSTKHIITCLANLQNDYYCAYAVSPDRKKETNILIYKNDSCINIFPSRVVSEPSMNSVGWGEEGIFYNYQNNLFFYELFNDTIYNLKLNDLIPIYKFDFGQKILPYEKKHSIEFYRKSAQDYYIVRNINESDKHVYFAFEYKNKYFTGVFDKYRNTTIINNNSENDYGFCNDINGFIPFRYITLSKNNELIGFYQSYQILQWFIENPDKAKKLPLHLQKFKNIKETDNPVIMIAKLKE